MTDPVKESTIRPKGRGNDLGFNIRGVIPSKYIEVHLVLEKFRRERGGGVVEGVVRISCLGPSITHETFINNSRHFSFYSYNRMIFSFRILKLPRSRFDLFPLPNLNVFPQRKSPTLDSIINDS